jgi:hypothetical protein
MEFITPETLRTSAVVIIAIVALVSGVRVVQLSRRKNGSNNEKRILEEVKFLNSNHLNSIEKTIREGNDKIVETINSGNMKIVASLGKIEGKLDK